MNNIVKKIAEVKWSQTNKCWYVPLNPCSYGNVCKALKEKVELDVTALKEYLEKRKQSVDKIKTPSQVVIEKKQFIAIPAIKPDSSIAETNKHILPAMRQTLVLKAYSGSTIKTYLNEMSQFLQAIKKHRAEEFTVERIKKYLQYCFEELQLSENTLHSRINAMKFYYEQVLGHEKFFWEIPRPQKQYILPKVLGESELKRLFSALQNKKHKAILFTAYSAGLRVSEVVNLQLKHIDRSRMQLFIKNAKGKKDRYVMLSPVLLDILGNYYKTSKLKPVKYIFEGPIPGTPYSASSMQKIFQAARRMAGINKDLSFHCLRHSFATHLLEGGVDIKYIRDLLGHFDIKTTSRYLHVKREQLVNIKSPLDGLMSKDEI